MNLIVWGAGQGYIDNKHLIEHLEYRLIDSSEEVQGKDIDGIEVEKPNIIYEAQYDYIIISTVLYFEEIYNKLITQYFVPSRQILRLFDVEKEILMRNIWILLFAV